jgi:hypothetical protein
MEERIDIERRLGRRMEFDEITMERNRRNQIFYLNLRTTWDISCGGRGIKIDNVQFNDCKTHISIPYDYELINMGMFKKYEQLLRKPEGMSL